MNHTNPALYAELSQIVADAVSRALLQVIQQAREGRGQRDKDKPQPPKISYTIAQAVAASGSAERASIWRSAGVSFGA